jgi:hypothetical protein
MLFKLSLEPFQYYFCFQQVATALTSSRSSCHLFLCKLKKRSTHPQTVTTDAAIGFPTSFCDVSVKIGSNPDLGEAVGVDKFSGSDVDCRATFGKGAAVSEGSDKGVGEGVMAGSEVGSVVEVG